MGVRRFVRVPLMVLFLLGYGCNSTTGSAPLLEPADRATTITSAAPEKPANAPASAAPTAAPSATAQPASSVSMAAPRPEIAETAQVPPLPQDAVPVAPPLVDAAGVMLPQTEDKPSVESALFRYRLARLVQAIAAGNADLARDFFFPKIAYEKVKSIKDAGKDWEARLWKLFQRDIAEYHTKLGDKAAGTTLVRLEVNESRIKWMKPQSEGNTLGYHRVTRNKLHVRDGGGTEHIFEITSFISWRGEWYVVHLHGFK